MPTKYKNIEMAQMPEIEEIFSQFIKEFDRIIEIGTYTGGMTLMLNDIKKSSADLISYDINQSYCQVPKKYALNIRFADVFNENTINDIKEMIEYDKKRVLVLCDGGNKVKEFNIFCKFLKPNDVIMTHDYAEYFEQWLEYASARGWLAPLESSLDSIKNDVYEQHLSKFEPYHEKLKKVLWGSFIKN